VIHDGKTLQLLALAPSSRWSDRQSVALEALRSFRRETDPDVLDASPAHLRVVTLTEAMTLAEAARRRGDVHVPLEELLILNGMDRDRELASGSKIKLPVGGRPS
jgi:predicted Zn-dependent protease